jgi:hypothetical protein
MSGSLRIRLADIHVDPDVQSRIEGLDLKHVRSLKQTPEDWGPIQVLARGDRYLLVAGFHRLAAAQDLKLEEIDVDIVDAPVDGDIRGLNFATNLTHGLRPSRADQRAECQRLLRLHPEWSDREIGRRCQFSQPTVAKIREDLEASAQLSTPDVRVGRGGYTYSSPRRPGVLPTESLGEQTAALGARVFSGPERARQRKIASYLGRLLVALDERSDLLDDPMVAAEAVRQVLDDERADDLAVGLGDAAIALHAVALSLGYDPDDAR